MMATNPQFCTCPLNFPYFLHAPVLSVSAGWRSCSSSLSGNRILLCDLKKRLGEGEKEKTVFTLEYLTVTVWRSHILFPSLGGRGFSRRVINLSLVAMSVISLWFVCRSIHLNNRRFIVMRILSKEAGQIVPIKFKTKSLIKSK